MRNTQCNCSTLVGDGCEVCNPKKANDYMNTEIPTPITDAARIDNADLHGEGYGKSELIHAATARLLERRLHIATEALKEIKNEYPAHMVAYALADDAIRQMEEVK